MKTRSLQLLVSKLGPNEKCSSLCELEFWGHDVFWLLKFVVLFRFFLWFYYKVFLTQLVNLVYIYINSLCWNITVIKCYTKFTIFFLTWYIWIKLHIFSKKIIKFNKNFKNYPKIRAAGGQNQFVGRIFGLTGNQANVAQKFPVAKVANLFYEHVGEIFAAVSQRRHFFNWRFCFFCCKVRGIWKLMLKNNKEIIIDETLRNLLVCDE